MAENKRFQEELTERIQQQMQGWIGEEEAENLQKKTPGISSGMQKVDGIVASVIQRAMGGDMSAVRFIFQHSEEQGAAESDKKEPFLVEFSVVDEI